jgi:dihydroorotase/N-acyl-D-amino-acid deacylase
MRLILIAALFLTNSPLLAQNQAPYDLVILHGRIVDGTGAAWFKGDLAIRGDRIVRLVPAGLLDQAEARLKLEAKGLIVAPGLVDIQAHSREALLTGDARVISKITQGITTEILGEGWTNAPINDQTETASQDPESLRAEFKKVDGFRRWLKAMEDRKIAVNVGSFVGATNARSYAMGARQGTPTAAELDTMRSVVRRAMEDGAFGLASALIYPPAAFASTAELVELAKVIRPYGGTYISHIRSEGDHFLEALDEAIQIGREAQVPVEVYHLKAMGRRNWPKIPIAIRRIDSARAAGIDVQANMYPYIATGTGWTACVPPWASADGKLFANLRDPSVRARIRAEMVAPRTSWENNCALSGADGMLIVATEKPENQRFAGKRLSEVARSTGKAWPDALLDLILSEGKVGSAVYFMMSEPNVELQMKQPWIKFGTDAEGLNPETARDLTHPRAYGSFPRILGHYVRDRRVIPLEDAIRKLTSAVTTRLSIADRGVLREGLLADIAIFDPATVADRATFERPHQLSVGMVHVLVNGIPVIQSGKLTGAMPGRAVRGAGARGTW